MSGHKSSSTFYDLLDLLIRVIYVLRADLLASATSRVERADTSVSDVSADRMSAVRRR